jgi:hypothetical protein
MLLASYAYFCNLLLTFMHHVALALMTSSIKKDCQASSRLTLLPLLNKASTMHTPSLGLLL